MTAFFEGIANFIQMISTFVVNLITGLFDLFDWIQMIMIYVAQLIVYLPPSILGIAGVFITISILYLVVDR